MRPGLPRSSSAPVESTMRGSSGRGRVDDARILRQERQLRGLRAGGDDGIGKAQGFFTLFGFHNQVMRILE